MQMPISVRGYLPAEEQSWLRCRVLSFLPTNYFDDVVTTKPTYDSEAIELVAAAADDVVVGILDIVVEGELATIETIAVHPDAARRRIGSRLLDEALRLLPAGVRTIDAWTRETPAANAWYVASGFEETFRYLHVYVSSERERVASNPNPRPGMVLVKGFFHATIDQEEQMRAEFSRVYTCRRYERPLR